MAKAKKMHSCDRVGLDFIDAAPHRYVNSVDLAATPEQIWEVLGDASAWPVWATAIKQVTWTTPEPHGVGTRRTVSMLGGLVGDEEFLAWEPGVRMAFRFNEASTRTVKGFAENYDIVATPEGCRVTWSVGMDVRGPSRYTMPMGKPVMNRMWRGYLKNLRAYTDEKYAVASTS